MIQSLLGWSSIIGTPLYFGWILWRMGRDREGAMIKREVRRLNREHAMRQRATLSAETHQREPSRPLAKGGAPSDAVSGKRG